MKIDKSILYALGIGIIVLVFGFIMLKGNENIPSGSAVKGDVQEITLGMKDYNYFPDTITVEVNKRVRIKLDSSVTGCFRDFTIREFNVRKYLKTPNDYVEFTPTKKGTFGFACSMNMGTGVLIVK